jgi:DNA-binding transcriptional regulator YdaS (Cro superfamily)
MSTVHTQTLRRAAEIAGGLSQLSTQLGVPERALEEWLQGTQPVPPEIFLRAVDIVTANHINELSNSHVKITPPSTDPDPSKPH